MLNRLKPSSVIGLILCLLLLLCSSCGSGSTDERMFLRADHNDGHDEVWQRRRFLGLASWAIRGSGVAESGSIWFNAFPWESGLYEVIIHAALEQDGSPAYELRAGERVLSSGRFPYLNGSLSCGSPGLASDINLGVHQISQGERIALWGESIYECGVDGAYVIWESIEFILVDTSV